MGLESGVSSEQASVLGETIDCLADLPHCEIDEGQTTTREVIFVTEGSNKWLDRGHSLFNACVAVLITECHASNAHEVVSDDVLEHKNSGFLCNVGTEEFRSKLLTEIEGDGLGLSQLDITIDDIW